MARADEIHTGDVIVSPSSGKGVLVLVRRDIEETNEVLLGYDNGNTNRVYVHLPSAAIGYLRYPADLQLGRMERGPVTEYLARKENG